MGALLCVLSLALLIEGLLGHLLHHVIALLPGHGDTFLASSIGIFCGIIFLILGGPKKLF